MLKLLKLPDETPIGPDDRVFGVCSCGGEALEVSRFEFRDGSGDVIVSFWILGNMRTRGWRSFRQKLRDLWRLLRYGNVYVDSVTLSPAQARAFGEEIVAMAEKAELATQKNEGNHVPNQEE